MQNRYIHTIWCDDIRQEIGNKPSLMGVYTGQLILPQLPMTLQRLGVFSTLSSPVTRPINSGIKIEVKRDDGHALLTIEADSPEFTPLAQDEEVTRIQIGTGFTLGPVELPVRCRYLVVEALIDGETIIGPKLWVKADAELFAQAMHPISPATPALPK